MSRDMFIRYQGELQGETELTAQIKAREYHAFARFGAFSSIVRQYGRVCWTEGGTKNTRGHLVAKHTRGA